MSLLLATLAATRVLTDIGHSLREGFYMLWASLWALALGFVISGAVQAFVNRDAMRRQLGDHRPAAVTRAALYGMASSSCSYAASAVARSLFAGGADFVASMVFMFASTNLVIELGIVLLALIGWQFLVAEFAGGIVMIVLLAALGGLWLRGRALTAARAAVRPAGGGADPTGSAARPGWRRRVRTRAGWGDAASFTIGDLTMLRRELVVGFVAAGFVSTLVPAPFWADVFVHGHGAWTQVENALVGPLVAVVSFVCSVGNIPLAAALWKAGISFGGVVAFVFADLISFPLLLVYRRQYGWAMAARMLAVFWVIMSAAGLLTGAVFDRLGLVPGTRPTVVAGDRFRLDWTTVLDVAALIVLAAVYGLHRWRERRGGGAGYATDPVCGMQVETAHAPASYTHEGRREWFCSEHCRDRFAADPGAFRSTAGSSAER